MLVDKARMIDDHSRHSGQHGDVWNCVCQCLRPQLLQTWSSSHSAGMVHNTGFAELMTVEEMHKLCTTKRDSVELLCMSLPTEVKYKNHPPTLSFSYHP